MPGEAIDTYEAINQPPPSFGRNLFETDPILIGALETLLGSEVEGDLSRIGAYWGSAEAFELARLANENLPVLNAFDRYGRRQDSVEFHPAYHALMRRSVENGLHSAIWEEDSELAGHRHAVRAAALYMTSQTEGGHVFPLSTTSAAVAALRANRPVMADWLPFVRARRYDHRPLAKADKHGVTIAVAFAEREAGTDLRAVATRAERVEDGVWRLDGHKWFVSSPMADAFVVLGQTPEGPSLFLVPRVTDDGEPNGVRLERLKPKLGNRANATAEITFDGALGHLLGEPGRGITVAAPLSALVRLDGALAAAGLMRAGLVEAVHYARHRRVFGSLLIEEPLMLRVLADLALDSLAATALVMRLALAYDAGAKDPHEAAFARIMTPAAKYWITKTAPALLQEAMECVGGNGCIEEGLLPRLYRDAPLHALWGGGGNLLCLEIARMVSSDPAALNAALTEIARDVDVDGPISVVDIRSAAAAAVSDPGTSRILTEQLALAGAAAALHKFAPRVLADAFVAGRLAGSGRATYGIAESRFDTAAIVDFAVQQ